MKKKRLLIRIITVLVVISMLAGSTGCKKKTGSNSNNNEQNQITSSANSDNSSTSENVHESQGSDQTTDEASADTPDENVDGASSDIINAAGESTGKQSTGGITTLGTGSKTGNFDLTGTISVPADGIGKPGVDFTDIPAGSVQGWDDFPITPGFNPLGDRDMYSESYSDEEYRTNTVYYLADDGYTSATMEINGRRIGLKIDNENPTRNWILYKAKAIGAKIYKSQDNKAFFTYTDKDNMLWFVDVDINYDSYNINEYYIPLLTPGEKLMIAGESMDYYGDSFRFCTKTAPGRQQGATLTFDGTTDDVYDSLFINRYSCFSIGDYSYRFSENVRGYVYDSICPMDGSTVVIDNIPAEPEYVFWTVSKSEWQGNYDAYISISETGDIDKINLGEQPGLLRIKGAGSDLGAELDAYASIWTSNCDEYSLDGGYRDNDGNYCFVAPAGYYRLEIGSEALGDFTCFLQNVPVSSGRITEVTIPSELKAYTSDLLQMGVSMENDAGNMDIISVSESGDSVTLGIIVHDPDERDLFPENKDFTITENGAEATVTKIEREPAGANVIMCIDSSGSIKKSLPSIIEAACKFVENLPENSTISIIEFKQELIEHKGNTKEEAIKALKSITAKGDTSLYDSISRALDRLEGMPRAYVIAFTDGVDSREPGDPAPGSSISKEDLCEKIKNSKATVLGMGFGSGHDATTLKMISESSVGGQYYYVADVNALDGAFAAVQSKFGNQFKVTYKRPVVVEDQASDVPVVSIMMDTSRSMNMLPEESDGDVDIRLERVRNLFHEFIVNLPDNMLGQFATFTTYSEGGTLIKTPQLLTDKKADLLRALSLEQVEGGTPIREALEIAYNSLKNQNSSKKVMVFFTDAALQVEDDGSGAEQQAFDETLEMIKKAGIRVLFAGLSGGKYASRYDSIFKYAADKAGGDYIISSSVEDIENKLNELLVKVDQPAAKAEGVNIFVDLTCKADDGSPMSYSAGKLAEELTIKTQKGTVKAPSTIQVKDAGAYVTYSGEVSALLYGADTSDETVITGRIPFTDAVASNQFADLSVSEAYLMTKFKGIDAGSSRSFLALNVTLTFHKKDKSAKEVGYQIPNIFNHFYVSLNNGRMMPVSEATYLAETPMVIPGESVLQVNELKDAKGDPLEIGESVSGIMVFVVQNASEWKQLSLHCYDTNYGHLELPLVGALPDTLMNITALPTEQPANISDSFKLSLTGCEDTRDIAGAEFNYVYDDTNPADIQNMRVLEMQFESKVQALLNIDPTQRFYYKIPTNSGDLLIRMSKAVNNLPLGFTGKTKFAPGSLTNVRLPFDVPEALKDNKATLWGEIAEGSFEMDINSGSAYKGFDAGQKYEHEYFTLVINKLAYSSSDSNKVILDFTIIDKKDGEGTGGFDTMLYLYRDVDGLDYETNTSKSPNGGTYIDAVASKGLGNFGNMSDMLEPVGIIMAEIDDTQKLVFGASDPDADWGAYDGQSRRGILIFHVPDDEFKKEWRLSAECLPDLSLAIDSKNPYGKSPLLVEKAYVETNTYFEDTLAAKVDAAVTAYRATHPDTATDKKIGLSDDEIIGTHIETPYLTLYGTQVIESVKAISDFYKVMQSLTWMPNGFEYSVFAPETVITQGYGFDADFCVLANRLLMKLGYKTTIKTFELNDAGRENLARFGGYCVDDGSDYEVCAILYTDEKGNSRVYVPAFRHYVEDLAGLGQLKSGQRQASEGAPSHITVTAYGEFTGDAGFAAQTGIFDQFADLFGGGDGDIDGYYEGVTLLDKEFNLANAGRNPMDISFISLGKDDDGIHEKIAAVADTADGLLKDGGLWVSSADYNFDRIEVTISSYSFEHDVTHTYMLNEGDSLLDVFMSIGVNLPTLTDAAVSSYEKALSDSIKAFAGIESTNYGTARWTTHAAVAKLAKSITDIDKDICSKLGVITTASHRSPVSVCATLKSDGKDAVGSADLMSLRREVLRTQETYDNGVDYDELNRGYVLAMSSLMSEGEGDAFPDGQTYLDVWATMPDDADILVIDCDYDERMNAVELYKTLGAPKYLLERLEKAPDYIAFQMPTAPGRLNGEEHWAWLEIDTDNMETISVFDTGERGMAAYIVGLTPKSAAEFTVGAFIGVSCSCFAVAAYTLESDDMDYVMEAARSLMGVTLERIKKFRSAVSDIKSLKENPKGFLEGKAKGWMNEQMGFNIMSYYDYLYSGDVNKLKQEPTFADGFEVAMKMYFGEWVNVGY